MRRGRALRRCALASTRPGRLLLAGVARREAGERLGGRCGVAQLRRNGGWFAARPRPTTMAIRDSPEARTPSGAGPRATDGRFAPAAPDIAARRTIRRGRRAHVAVHRARRVRARNRGAPAERPAAMFCIPTRCRRRVSSLPARGDSRPDAARRRGVHAGDADETQRRAGASSCAPTLFIPSAQKGASSALSGELLATHPGEARRGSHYKEPGAYLCANQTVTRVHFTKSFLCGNAVMTESTWCKTHTAMPRAGVASMAWSS